MHGLIMSVMILVVVWEGLSELVGWLSPPLVVEKWLIMSNCSSGRNAIVRHPERCDCLLIMMLRRLGRLRRKHVASTASETPLEVLTLLITSVGAAYPNKTTASIHLNMILKIWLGPYLALSLVVSIVYKSILACCGWW